MYEILDLQAKNKIRKRRQELRLPFTAHSILSDSLSSISSTVESRVWCLPETPFIEEIKHYCKKHKSSGISGPRPKLRSLIKAEFSEELAIKIDTSLNFANLANSADLLIKPILLYYASAHLCGVYTRAFFEWEKDQHTHGLSCQFNRGDVGQTLIKIQKQGQFSRIAACCFLLTGHPNCFTTLVTYSSSPIAHTGSGELLEKFCAEEKGEPADTLTLDALVKYNYGTELKKVRERHGFHKFNGLPTTAFLVDVITLFVGSSLARYNVLGWKQILEGKDNPYWIHFEDTFARFQLFTIDALLERLDDPFSDFDKRLIPSQPSPYSGGDHSRFKNNPNYE